MIRATLRKSLASRKETPQTKCIPGREADHKQNNAGGFSFVITPEKQFERFLILGTEGGTYYVSPQKLTADNTKNVKAFIASEPQTALRLIKEISVSGRAYSNEPALFALALAASAFDLKTRSGALGILPDVARTGTHLFSFVDYAQQLRGWGHALRQGVADWYHFKTPEQFAYQALKYQNRNGFTHRDVFRLAHPKFRNTAHARIAEYIIKGSEVKASYVLPKIVYGTEALKKLQTSQSKLAATFITDFELPREVVPTHFLNSPEVWEALLYSGKHGMPITALIRNLGKMTSIGLLSPFSDAQKFVVQKLTNEDVVKQGRVHPLTAFIAQQTYGGGHSIKGSLIWVPQPQIVAALETTYDLGFQNVIPSGKNILLALDVSGSMAQEIQGLPLSAREGTALMALITARTEPHTESYAFSTGFIPFSITKRSTPNSVVKQMERLSFGATDCSLPMTKALKNKWEVDAFVVYTDSETWAGEIAPSQALLRYNQKMGREAKLVVVGMTATKFSIADPQVSNMLDVVGFDTSAPSVISDFVAT